MCDNSDSEQFDLENYHSASVGDCADNPPMPNAAVPAADLDHRQAANPQDPSVPNSATVALLVLADIKDDNDWVCHRDLVVAELVPWISRAFEAHIKQGQILFERVYGGDEARVHDKGSHRAKDEASGSDQAGARDSLAAVSAELAVRGLPVSVNTLRNHIQAYLASRTMAPAQAAQVGIVGLVHLQRAPSDKREAVRAKVLVAGKDGAKVAKVESARAKTAELSSEDRRKALRNQEKKAWCDAFDRLIREALLSPDRDDLLGYATDALADIADAAKAVP